MQEDHWQRDVPCPVCGSGDREPIPRALNEPGYVFVRCRPCGMKFYSPRLRETYMISAYLGGTESKIEAHNLYNTGAFSGKPQGGPDAQKKELRSYYRSLLGLMLAEFDQTRKPRSLYEAGCNVGWFLSTARETIPVVRGCDANPHAVAIGTVAFGVPIEPGAFLSQKIKDAGSYDLVVALDYIEHTYTPVQDLTKMYEIAAPGAVLMLKTFLDELDTNGAYVNPIHHVNHFSASTLRQAVESAGWEIVNFDDQRERVWAQVIVIARKPIKATAGPGWQLTRLPRLLAGLLSGKKAKYH